MKELSQLKEAVSWLNDYVEEKADECRMLRRIEKNITIAVLNLDSKLTEVENETKQRKEQGEKATTMGA